MTALIDLLRAYFRPQFLATIGSIVGIGSGLNSLFGGNDSGGGSPAAPSYSGAGNTLYTPTGTGTADTTWQQMLAQMFSQQQGVNAGVTNPITSAYNNQLGINQQPLINAGNVAGGQYGNLAGQATGFSNQLGAAGTNQLQAGQDIYNLGRDPQNQMHDFLQQQVVDSSRAGTSSRGLGMSPYAAGLEDDATRKFNMDWQNQLLGRANTGLTAMDNANRVAGADFSGALNMGGQAPGYTLQGANAPIQAQAQAYGAPAQYATQYAGNVGTAMQGPEAALMAQIIPYLNFGAGAGSYAANAGLNSAQFGAGQQTQGLERILAGMQNFGNNPGSWLQGMGSNQGYGSYAGGEDPSAGGTFNSGAW